MWAGSSPVGKGIGLPSKVFHFAVLTALILSAGGGPVLNGTASVGVAYFCHWLWRGSDWTCARRADTSTVSFSAEGRLHGTVSIFWILLISRWLARWIVGDWVSMVRFPSSLYPCMISRDFSYGLTVVLPLISWTISELNFLILLWIRLSLSLMLYTPRSAREESSRSSDSSNGAPRVLMIPSTRSFDRMRVVRSLFG